MKKLLLLLTILYNFYNTNAQTNIDKIDLNEYKTTDYNYKSLGLYATYGGGNIASYYNNSVDKKNDWKNSNVLSFSIRHRRIKHTRKRQLSRYLSFSTKPSFVFGKSYIDDNYNVFQIANKIYFQESNRFYLNNKKFIHLGVQSNLYQDFLNSSDDKTDQQYFDFSLELPLLFGWGRIEVVSNAWRAYRIVQDLNKYDLLLDGAQFGKNDIFKIADYITKRNFTRAFDYRDKYKEDMVGLTNAFMKNKADISNPIYYASLYDMWEFSISNIRRTGTAFSIGVQPEFVYIFDERLNVNSKKTNINTFFLAQFEYYKALNLNWQLDFIAKIKTGLNNVYGKDDIESIISPSIHIGIGYYPDTRTSFKSQLSISDMAEYEDYFNLDNIGNYFRFKLENNLYYYVSPKVRLSAYFNLTNKINYSKNPIHFNRKIHLEASYGIKYSVFIF